MANIRNIPKGATLKAQIRGTINKPDAWTNGKTVSVELWSAVRSMGYKTDYQAVPVLFFALRIQGERPKCKQFSGARYLEAVETFESWKADLLPYMPDATIRPCL